MRKIFVVLIPLLLIVVTSAAQSAREAAHRVTFDTELGLAIATAYNDGSWDVTYEENTDAFEVFDVALLGPIFADLDTLFLPVQLDDEERLVYNGFQVYDLASGSFSDDITLFQGDEYDYEGLILSSISPGGHHLWLTAVYGTHAYLVDTVNGQIIYDSPCREWHMGWIDKTLIAQQVGFGEEDYCFEPGLKLIDVETGEVSEIVLPEAALYRMPYESFTLADGRLLVAPLGFVRSKVEPSIIVDPATATASFLGSAYRVKVSPDGTLLGLSSEDNSIKVIDIQTGDSIFSFSTSARDFGWHEGALSVWEFEGTTLYHIIDSDRDTIVLDREPTRLDVSPDGGSVVITNVDGIQIYDKRWGLLFDSLDAGLVRDERPRIQWTQAAVHVSGFEDERGVNLETVTVRLDENQRIDIPDPALKFVSESPDGEWLLYAEMVVHEGGSLDFGDLLLAYHVPDATWATIIDGVRLSFFEKFSYEFTSHFKWAE